MSTVVCLDCLTTVENPLHDQHRLVYMGRNWRAPRRTNSKAWARISKGEYLWDRAAVRSKATRKRIANEEGESIVRREGRKHPQWRKQIIGAHKSAGARRANARKMNRTHWTDGVF